ncbi:MAG: hypothetical protein GH143_07105 [Calditrichaeota bacterium]|nr:hypothetical protein [Calditrichota bacterium]
MAEFSFPRSQKIINEFQTTINAIGDIFNDKLMSSEFRRAPLFYSLFCVIYDAKFGLPKSNHPRLSLTKKRNKILLEELQKLDKVIRTKEPAKRFVSFVDAAKLSTADPGKRKLRHDFLWDNVLSKI